MVRGDSMKVGSIVFSKYPRIDGGMGIVLQYNEGSLLYDTRMIAASAKVRWALTGKEKWYKAWDLEVIV